MRSVKPGRGPSMMRAIGSIAAIIFGIIWTIAAASMNAPIFFPLFGLVFIGLGIVQAVYNFRNATRKNRYSAFDITDGNEEPDPLNERFGETHGDLEPGRDFNNMDGCTNQPGSEDANFCPYCGAKLKPGYQFCKHCGKQID